MKKLALIVSVLMLFSMVACADNGNVDDDANISDEVTDGDDIIDGDDAVDEGAVTDDETGNTDTDGSGGANGGNGNDNGENQTLTGKAQGYGGEVSVTVEVNGEDIVSVDVVGEKETQGVGSNAIDQLPAKIEEADSTDVEVVSGATVTSNAIKEAVDKALEGIK